MRLQGKVALVTGASRGIGFAVAKLFAGEGAIVYAGSSSNPSGIFPVGVTGVELDVSKEEHWKRVVSDIVAAHGRLDVLVNNAGIAVYDAVHDCSTENWRRVLGVNQDGCFFGMREVIPHMKAHQVGMRASVPAWWVPWARASRARRSRPATTPEADDLQALLARMRDAAADTVAMEVSSHALDQRRVDGVQFAAVCFTNRQR